MQCSASNPLYWKKKRALQNPSYNTELTMTACSQWTENPSGARRRKRQMSIAHAIDSAALQKNSICDAAPGSGAQRLSHESCDLNHRCSLMILRRYHSLSALYCYLVPATAWRLWQDMTQHCIPWEIGGGACIHRDDAWRCMTKGDERKYLFWGPGRPGTINLHYLICKHRGIPV